MSESEAKTEQEISEAAIELANEYRQAQREDAEAERKRNPEKPETEEEFLDRVYTVSENSAGGFSAPYVRPLEEDEPQESVEEVIEGGDEPQGSVIIDPTNENPDAGSLRDVDAENAALFGRNQDPAPVQSKDDPQDSPEVEETPSTEGTEVVSDDTTTIVDTGYTDPKQIETAQGIANAVADSKEEGDDSSETTEETKVKEPAKEKEYSEILKDIKAAKTVEEVDSALNGDTRRPLVQAADKRRKEVSA